MNVIKSWERLSLEYGYAPYFFSQKAMEIEKECVLRPRLAKSEYLKLVGNHQAYVTGCIFSAVAFLEAIINELFLEADKYVRGEHGNQNDLLRQLLPSDAKIQDTLTPLTSPVLVSMAQVWNTNRIRFSNYPRLSEVLDYADHEKDNRPRNWFVLNKYQLALYLANKDECSKTFDENDQLQIEVQLLVRFRNYLMHYNPQWIAFYSDDESYEAQEARIAQLAKELRAHGFKNPFRPNNINVAGLDVMVSSFGSFLGANCAEWAALQSKMYVCEFARRMPVEIYEKIYCP
jgi:hypothetical protein